MTMNRFLRPLPLAFVALTLLAGCQSDEEKAENFYQSALTYLEQDDPDRAMIELRNVFDHNGFHKEARALFASLLMRQGKDNQAYGQYLRLVEQYPDTVEAREALGLMALERRNWDEATRHGEAAIALDPERPGTRAIAVALAYRDAVTSRDTAAESAAVDRAQALLVKDPSVQAARRVLIDAALRQEDYETALTEADIALEHSPNSFEFHMVKVRILAVLQREEETGAQLTAMYDLFPQNEEIRNALIRWYMSRGDFQGAANFLRGEAGPAGEDAAGNLAVVELLRRAAGNEAAEAELNTLIAAAEGGAAEPTYRSLLASLEFERGNQEQAIATLQGLLDGAAPSEQTHQIRTVLARMLASTGNPVGAREQVELILENDASHVAALKMRAAALIREDRPGDAIIDLRTALDQNPRDTELLTLMADAHIRSGSPELAQERLSMAVQISDGGAEESIRYARFLMAQGRVSQAENVMVNARKASPGNLDVLRLLGELYMRQRKFPQTQGVIDALRTLDSEQSLKLADSFQGGLLLAQDRVDEGLGFLRSQIDADGNDDLGAVVQLVRTMVLSDRLDEARNYVDEQLAADPGETVLQLLSANLHTLQGQLPEAEEIYRAVLDSQPGNEAAALLLQSLLRATGQTEAADQVVSDALAARPDAARLRMLDAHRLERIGDYDGAIAIYDSLYEINSNNVVVANNLASMLSNHRDTPEALERAYAIARRLDSSEVPAFQDTLGWILHQRGNNEDALPRLQAAAKGLPQDPTVAIHLGLVYAELGQMAQARAELERALALAGDRELPFKDRAQKILDSP